MRTTSQTGPRNTAKLGRGSQGRTYKMRILAAVATALFVATAGAQAPARDPAAELQAAFKAAKAVMQAGPADVKLIDQGTLHLPAGFVFIPKNESIRVLKAMGNRPSADTLGMVFPRGDGENWFLVARYISSGYIKDDDAKDWKADELLENIKKGTEQANEDRRKIGVTPMEIVGWVERPAYDPSSHRLVWSLSSKDKGAPAGRRVPGQVRQGRAAGAGADRRRGGEALQAQQGGRHADRLRC